MSNQPTIPAPGRISTFIVILALLVSGVVSYIYMGKYLRQQELSNSTTMSTAIVTGDVAPVTPVKPNETESEIVRLLSSDPSIARTLSSYQRTNDSIQCKFSLEGKMYLITYSNPKEGPPSLSLQVTAHSDKLTIIHNMADRGMEGDVDHGLITTSQGSAERSFDSGREDVKLATGEDSKGFWQERWSYNIVVVRDYLRSIKPA